MIFDAIIALLLIGMVIALIKNLNKSLYRYSNLMLLTGILFFASFIAVELCDMIRCGIAGIEMTPAHKLQAFLDFPAVFTSFALWVLGIVALLLCVSNIALIRHEGLRPKNVLGLVLSAVYIGGTIAVQMLDRYLNLHKSIIVFFLLIICYMECFLLATGIMGWFAAIQKPKYDKDFIIIPGCAISRKGGLLPLLKGRTNRAVRYAWDQEIASGRPVKYVPSGGQGPDEIMSEGSAMELYLLSHGAEADEVFPEKKSVNTYENFKFSREIILQQDPDANIAFATTNYHMLRCGLIANRLGMDAEGISSETKWYFWPNGFVREFIAIIAMDLKVHLAVCAACAAAAAGSSLLL